MAATKKKRTVTRRRVREAIKRTHEPPAAEAPAPRPTYDDSNAKKSDIGAWVEYRRDGDAADKRLLAGIGSRWRWKNIAGRRMLEIEEPDGQIGAQIPAEYVTAVGGRQYLFRDAEWK